MQKLKVLDLFSGIGGFSLGLERTGGFETVAFCEIEDYPRRVLAKHWPEVPCHEDVRALDGNEYRGTVDVICGGFPCKQTSLAAAISGNRVGLNGKDSGRWWDYRRLVRTIRPAWVIVENPPGVNRWAGTIQTGLERAGYRVSRFNGSSSSCGAAHKRERVFFVANRHGKGLPITGASGPPKEINESWPPFAGGVGMQDNARALRVDDGLSSRVDRITALGNSVDPRVVELVGQAILKAETNLPGTDFSYTRTKEVYK